jgi:hypothetical protein
MSLPGPRKTTPRAVLGSVPRIDFSNYALSLDLIAGHIEYHTTRPDGEPSVPSLRSMLALTEIKILEDKNTIIRSPFDQFLRSAIAEILSSTRSLSSQPFEVSNNTSSILSLCLSLSKLSLKSLDRLRSALVLDFPIQAAYKKLVTICIDSHNSVSLVEIDSNWVNPLNIRKFNCIGHITNNLVSKIFDYDAIDLSGIAKVFSEGIRNHILEVLTAIDCGNTQESIRCETCVPSPFSNKEKSERVMPVERMIHIVSILIGSSISTSSKPDACTGKLAGYRSFDITVDSAMQIKSFKRLTEVPGSLRYVVAYLSKAIKSLDERFIVLDNYLQGSLSKHQLGDTTIRINTLRFSGGE